METPQYNDHDLRYVCVRLCVCVICVTVAVLGAFKCVLLVSLPCFFFFFVLRISYVYSALIGC